MTNETELAFFNDGFHTFKAAAPRANQPSGNKEFIAIADSLIYNQTKTAYSKLGVQENKI